MWQDSAAFRNVSSVQLSAFGGLPAGYIACTSMSAYFFIRSMREQGPLIWLPMLAGTPSHLPFGLAEVSDRVVYFAVLLDKGIHDVVHGLKQIGIGVWPPGVHRQNVMARFGLSFRGCGQDELVALARDVIDRNLDLFLRSPLIDEIGRGLVGAGHPVIPKAQRQLAGGVSTAHIGRGDERCGCTRRWQLRIVVETVFVTFAPSLLIHLLVCFRFLALRFLASTSTAPKERATR